MKNYKILNLFDFDVCYHEHEFQLENLNAQLSALLIMHVWLRLKALVGWLANI